MDRRGFEDHGDGVWKNRVQPFFGKPPAEPNTLVQLEDESLVPPVALRAAFAKEIRAVILRELLGGQETFAAVSDEFGELEFHVPQDRQLLDFVSVRQADDPCEVEVTVQYPHRREEAALRTKYWTQSFHYAFPVPYQLIKQG